MSGIERIPYSGIVPPALQQNRFLITETLKRVLIPSSFPVRFETRCVTNATPIPINPKQDNPILQYLTNPSGQKIRAEEGDFYITVKVRVLSPSTPFLLRILQVVFTVLKKIFLFLQPSKEATGPKIPLNLATMNLFFLLYPEAETAQEVRLPSSLFYGAKENDIVSFCLDSRPIELVLKQKNQWCNTEKNFEDAFEKLAHKMQMISSFSHESKKRISTDFFSLLLESKQIEKNTVFFFPKETSVPSSEEVLEKITQYKKESLELEPYDLNKTSSFLKTGESIKQDASGEEILTIELYTGYLNENNIYALIDGNSIYITAKRTFPPIEKIIEDLPLSFRKSLNEDLPADFFYTCKFDKQNKSVDLEKCSLSLNNDKLSLKIAFK